LTRKTQPVQRHARRCNRREASGVQRTWLRADRRERSRSGLTNWYASVLLGRRGGDSNPRCRDYRHNGFRDRRIQPLCHLSTGEFIYSDLPLQPSPAQISYHQENLEPVRSGYGCATTGVCMSEPPRSLRNSPAEENAAKRCITLSTPQRSGVSGSFTRTTKATVRFRVIARCSVFGAVGAAPDLSAW
jgi:hypothetical protein